MNILGLSVTRAKAGILGPSSNTGQLQGVDNRGWYRILESWAGAWQHDVEITLDNVTTHPAVFACTTLIANDIAKMRLRLVQQDSDGIWAETESAAFSPVLRRPNHYQNRIQFIANWVTSKLLHGNTYVLKIHDQRRVVTALYILDPQRVRPLVSPRGDVFYELKRDDLSQLPLEEYTIPASEIIHDHWNELFHPLVGLSPIYACGLAAVQGLNIQTNSTNFFGNGSRPGGVLTAPGTISQPAADRLKAYFDTNFAGENAGKVAVLGDGLKYEQMTMSATDAQLIEQLKWSSETICSVYHVPAYMAGFGAEPSYNNVQARTQNYYSQALQVLIEAIELCLDEGLGLTTGDVAMKQMGTEFDLDDLLRMDSAALIAFLESGRNYFKPNEGRKRLNLPPVEGGDVVLRQQQDFSLEALNKRDSKPDPFGSTTPPPTPSLVAPPPDSGDEAKHAATVLRFKARAAVMRRAYEQVHVERTG